MTRGRRTSVRACCAQVSVSIPRIPGQTIYICMICIFFFWACEFSVYYVYVFKKKYIINLSFILALIVQVSLSLKLANL